MSLDFVFIMYCFLVVPGSLAFYLLPSLGLDLTVGSLATHKAEIAEDGTKPFLLPKCTPAWEPSEAS